MRAAFMLLALVVSVVAGAEDRPLLDQKQTVTTGGVTATVTPLAASGAQIVEFLVVLETHTASLPDLLKAARLVGDDGKEVAPLSWTGGTGGHHLSGKLTFPSGARLPNATFWLLLKAVGGDAGMRFEWKALSQLAGLSTQGGQ